ncbi:MAG TPA: argininosuccinate lyase [Candidatus Dormibacteraeota bacterium]|nr:argininosuccinate lyase [Candidatus Dormibacteraeota bacterium]
MNSPSLQWGGRFSGAPDKKLLAFGSSLNDDLPLAAFDALASQAHVRALLGGGIIEQRTADDLQRALECVGREIDAGEFASLDGGAEDIHGAIDARVRELAPEAGAWLHAGRSRNDQVATALCLYAAARARSGRSQAVQISRHLVDRARCELARQTLLAGSTHGQPAQPILLAFWLAAAAEPFARVARAFASTQRETMRSMPLGSGALAGSGLPLDRAAAARFLGFAGPSRNAMDAVGTRDALLDCAHLWVRGCAAASRISAELLLWAGPQFSYVRVGDASSTGSSLMPQKRNPDIFELVRATAHEVASSYSGALATTLGLPLSYQRDLQQCKRLAMAAIERSTEALDAFATALLDISFLREKMGASALLGYTVATDIADALIAAGTDAREAHRLVGSRVLEAENDRRTLDERDLQILSDKIGNPTFRAPLDADASVAAKRTDGSTSPGAVSRALDELADELTYLENLA